MSILNLPQALPSWLAAHIQKRNKQFSYSSYSVEQLQIWSQECVSLRGSSANLKEWESRMSEKIALTEKVII